MCWPVDGRRAVLCAIAILAVAAQPLRAQSPDTLPSDTDTLPVDLDQLDPSIDWNVLSNLDTSLLDMAPGKTVTIVATPRETSANWKRTDARDGSAAITVNRSLPTAWDTKIGVDFGLPATPSPLTTPERLLAGTSPDQSSGVAWAKTTAPALNLPLGWDKASLDARFDPLQDQSTFGTRFSRSLPLGNQMSVTMESGFAVTHVGSQPLVGDPSSDRSDNVFDTDRLAKLNFLATGTSLGAGSRKSSADDVWLNSLTAEQKLFGGISVTGTVSETLEKQTSKSLTAGFKRTW